MSKSKVNPRKIPVSKADIQKSIDSTRHMMCAIFLTVMRDKFGYTSSELRKIWTEIENLSDSISKGYVNIQDLQTVLNEEEGIRLLE